MARQTKMFCVADTFGIPAPKTVEIMGFEHDPNAPGAAYIPKVDPDYVFRPDLLRDLLGWWRMSYEGVLKEEGFIAFGQKGTGKTSLINQVAARLNIPVLEVTGHGRMEVSELIGSNTVIGGDIMFADGPFTIAARIGGWVLVNEADAIDPSQQVGLNSLAERRTFLIPDTGEQVVPDPFFRFIITANTNMGGDQTGMFAGTQKQNSAFADRFFMTEIGYPDAATEKAIVQKLVPAITDEVIQKMVEFAGMVRKLFNGEEVKGVSSAGSLDVTMSTRTLVRWAKLTWFFQATPVPIQYALDRAFAFQADPDTRTVLHEVLQRVFGTQGGKP